MTHSPLKIAVIDAGPTGLSSAILLSQRHEVVIQGTPSDVRMINAGLSPHNEPAMAYQLHWNAEHLRATPFIADAVQGAGLVLVGTTTDFDSHKRTVNTRRLDQAIERVLALAPKATVVIESTVPVGYTARISRRLKTANVMVAPALLRNGLVMHDRLHPGRLLVGETSVRARRYGELMQKACAGVGVPLMLTHSGEAEAIQLFAQKQLLTLTRVPHSELVCYAARHGLDPAQLEQGLQFECVAAAWPAQGRERDSVGHGSRCGGSTHAMGSQRTHPRTLSHSRPPPMASTSGHSTMHLPKYPQ
jgi:UDPglucose 6-dehydrogenase